MDTEPDHYSIITLTKSKKIFFNHKEISQTISIFTTKPEDKKEIQKEIDSAVQLIKGLNPTNYVNDHAMADEDVVVHGTINDANNNGDTDSEVDEEDVYPPQPFLRAYSQDHYPPQSFFEVKEEVVYPP